MKKIMAWILSLIMLCTLLTACGGQQPSHDTSSDGTTDQTSSEEMREITHKFLSDLYKYDTYFEQLYGDMQWALSYLGSFFEDHSWDSLQIARAAMSRAKFMAENRESPEMHMTLDDYDKLVQSGADVAPFSDIQELKDSVFIGYQIYRNYLNSPAELIFSNYDLTHFENWANLKQQINNSYLHFFAIQTDYLLLQVDDEEEEARFIEAITEDCPQINAWRAGNSQDPDALMEDLDNLLDEMTQQTIEMSTIVGQAQAGLHLYSDAIDNAGNTDNLRDYAATMAADIADIKDFPIALPYPDWWLGQSNETFTYIWHDTDGEQIFLRTGDIIDTPPDKYVVKWEDVSLEDYLSYVERTEKEYNIPVQSTLEEEGIHTTFYKSQSASFALSWKENVVSFYALDGPVCFAPYWYVFHTRLSS